MLFLRELPAPGAPLSWGRIALPAGTRFGPYCRCSKKSTVLPGDAPKTLFYLRGESLALPGDKGWTLVTVDGYPLGWGKQDGTLLKNHYPKGLRWL